MEILRPTSSDSARPILAPNHSEIPQPQPELDLEDMYCILQVDPHDSFIAMELARRLRGLGRAEESLRVLRSVVKIDSGFESIRELASVEYELDHIEDALAHFQEALLIAPANEAALFEIFRTVGNIHTRLGNYDLAEDNYHRAHRLQPDSDVLSVCLGTLAIQRADWDGSTEWFRQALGRNGANDKAWVGLALGHRMKGDLELAWGNLEAALQHNPLNETALGLALDWGANQGREFRALELIRAFLVAGGWNERLSLAFAWLSWRRGETSRARLEVERLLAVNPASERALNLLIEMAGS